MSEPSGSERDSLPEHHSDGDVALLRAVADGPWERIRVEEYGYEFMRPGRASPVIVSFAWRGDGCRRGSFKVSGGAVEDTVSLSKTILSVMDIGGALPSREGDPPVAVLLEHEYEM